MFGRGRTEAGRRVNVLSPTVDGARLPGRGGLLRPRAQGPLRRRRPRAAATWSARPAPCWRASWSSSPRTSTTSSRSWSRSRSARRRRPGCAARRDDRDAAAGRAVQRRRRRRGRARRRSRATPGLRHPEHGAAIAGAFTMLVGRRVVLRLGRHVPQAAGADDHPAGRLPGRAVADGRASRSVSGSGSASCSTATTRRCPHGCSCWSAWSRCWSACCSCCRSAAPTYPSSSRCSTPSPVSRSRPAATCSTTCCSSSPARWSARAARS